MKPKTDWSTLQRHAVAAAHEQEVKALEKRLERHEVAIRDLEQQLEVALAVNRARPKAIQPVVRDNTKGEATAVAIASDWHVEEVVRPESVNGLNEFNLKVAETRVARFFEGILKLTEIQRHGIDIPNLFLFLGGDLMTGYIHEELQESNELSPVQTVIWLRDRILAGLRQLEDHGGFKRIIIPCAHGNHSRTTRKPRHATAAANSYEWLLYQVLAKHAPQFEWNIAEGYHTYTDIYGRVVRTHHGDNIRYEGGIGGLTIPLEKAIAAWNKAKVADLDLAGHWHQQIQSPKFCMNGSLIGFNAFSVAIKAPFEPPQQTYFLMDAKRGRTITAPITL